MVPFIELRKIATGEPSKISYKDQSLKDQAVDAAVEPSKISYKDQSLKDQAVDEAVKPLKENGGDDGSIFSFFS